MHRGNVCISVISKPQQGFKVILFSELVGLQGPEDSFKSPIRQNVNMLSINLRKNEINS